MKYIPYYLILLLLFSTLSCHNLDLEQSTTACTAGTQTFTYSKSAAVQTIIDKYTRLGLPGVAIAIKDGSQEWAGASGFAKVENQTPMRTCHLQYSQSLSKSYTGILMMMLYEDGKVNLDDPIDKYLPSAIAAKIKGSDKVTVRHLLSHTSGIHDYNDISYIANLLSTQDKHYTPDDLLQYVYGKDLEFEPGSKYSYANTNFLLLALMINEITGKDHSIMMTERIFKPLGLQHTYYKNEPGYLAYPELVNCYLDRRSTGKIENVSRSQVINVSYLIGDDGIVATPLDYIHFLNGLLNAQLVKPETLALMLQYVKDDKGEPAYGLGIDYTKRSGVLGYGHGGSGFGAGCMLYHFPDKDVTIFIGVNLSTFVEGPLTKLYHDMQDEVTDLLLK